MSILQEALKQQKKPKPGRPVLPNEEAKREMLRIRVTSKELRKIVAAAQAKGQTVSQFIRSKLLATAEA
jgi:uncharacterized protein (DUF1778 family)